FLQIVILPPGLGYMMVGENLAAGGNEKPGAKKSHVHFRTAPGKAHQRAVVLISGRLATARQSGVTQSGSAGAVPESKHDTDEADARLIGPDNRLRHLALSLEFLNAAFYSG